MATNESHLEDEFTSLAKCGKQRYNHVLSSQSSLIKFWSHPKTFQKWGSGQFCVQSLITTPACLSHHFSGFKRLEYNVWIMAMTALKTTYKKAIINGFDVIKPQPTNLMSV